MDFVSSVGHERQFEQKILAIFGANKRNFHFPEDCDCVNVGAIQLPRYRCEAGRSYSVRWTQMQGCLWPKSVWSVTRKTSYAFI